MYLSLYVPNTVFGVLVNMTVDQLSRGYKPSFPSCLIILQPRLTLVLPVMIRGDTRSWYLSGTSCVMCCFTRFTYNSASGPHRNLAGGTTHIPCTDKDAEGQESSALRPKFGW